MPLIKEKNEIWTNVLDVTISDGIRGRQQLLMDMQRSPEMIESIYIKNNHILVNIGDKSYILGRLKDKYSYLINNENTFIKSWKITGGEVLKDPIYRNKKMPYGININIKII